MISSVSATSLPSVVAAQPPPVISDVPPGYKDIFDYDESFQTSPQPPPLIQSPQNRPRPYPRQSDMQRIDPTDAYGTASAGIGPSIEDLVGILGAIGVVTVGGAAGYAIHRKQKTKRDEQRANDSPSAVGEDVVSESKRQPRSDHGAEHRSRENQSELYRSTETSNAPIDQQSQAKKQLSEKSIRDADRVTNLLGVLPPLKSGKEFQPERDEVPGPKTPPRGGESRRKAPASPTIPPSAKR